MKVMETMHTVFHTELDTTTVSLQTTNTITTWIPISKSMFLIN